MILCVFPREKKSLGKTVLDGVEGTGRYKCTPRFECLANDVNVFCGLVHARYAAWSLSCGLDITPICAIKSNIRH
jgi:hypothetical protein